MTGGDWFSGNIASFETSGVNVKIKNTFIIFKFIFMERHFVNLILTLFNRHVCFGRFNDDFIAYIEIWVNVFNFLSKANEIDSP